MAASLSQHLMIPFMFKLSYGGDKNGIFGATPFETLHTLLLGLIKRSCLVLFQYSSWKSDKKSGTSTRTQIFNVPEFERRLRILSKNSMRQSDRNMSRFGFNNGVTTLAGIQGQEYFGLSLLTTIALPGLLHGVQNSYSLESKFSSHLWKGISVYRWLSSGSVL